MGNGGGLSAVPLRGLSSQLLPKGLAAAGQAALQLIPGNESEQIFVTAHREILLPSSNMVCF